MTKSARELGNVLSLVCVLAGVQTASAQGAPSNASSQNVVAMGRLRGVVWDSMLMKPLSGAVVWIPGHAQTATTDDKGHYELVDVPVGRRTVAISSTSFDSTGLGTLHRDLVVQPKVFTDLLVFTPTLERVWREVCKGIKTTPLDSGIAWGTVRDASTGIRQSNARVAFNWYDAHVAQNKKMLVEEVTRDVRTDSTGTYYICGLPTDMRVSSEAAGTQSASGIVEYLIGSRRMARVDLLVSTDMVLQPMDRDRTPAESLAALAPHGRATLRGVVRDTKGVVQSNATITLASVDTVIRTNELGEFRLSNLPAGTHVLQVRQVGYVASAALVDLVPDSTTTAILEMSKATELATVNVRAERVPGTDKRNYDLRRREGWGYALEYKDFKARFDVPSILQGMPGVYIKRVRPGEFLLQTASPCTAIFLDGVRTPVDGVSQYRPEDLRAVEVYPRFSTSPAMYATMIKGEGCGTILMWSKWAKW